MTTSLLTPNPLQRLRGRATGNIYQSDIFCVIFADDTDIASLVNQGCQQLSLTGVLDLWSGLRLQKRNVDAAAPDDGDVLTWSASLRKWTPLPVPATPGATSTLFNQTQAVTVGNSGAESPLTGTGIGSLLIPANFLKVGTAIKLWMSGFHSATGNPNITHKVKLGSTVVASTGAVASGNSTNNYWELRMLLTCLTTGAGGTVMGQGYYNETGGGTDAFGMVNTAAVALDTTVDQTLSETVQWGTAALGNTITCTNALLEVAVP